MDQLVLYCKRVLLPSSIAVHGWIGVLLVACAWPLNWLLSGSRTLFLFFPLWLGYILVVDAQVFRRRGTSLLSRSKREFVLLFFVSALSWWIFEVINWRTANWHYIGGEALSSLEYFVFASICFSTVMPAVFSTAELMGTFNWIERFAYGPRVPNNAHTHVRLFLLGCIMIALLLIWPRYWYALVWTSLFCILEPINLWLGRQSIWARLADGDWRGPVALWSGTLVCGFFWEMWNFYSMPKWIYHVPFVDFLHVFEMPLLGYLGYVPFGLELYALVNLMLRRNSVLNT
jgi:hypothetical protein